MDLQLEAQGLNSGTSIGAGSPQRDNGCQLNCLVIGIGPWAAVTALTGGLQWDCEDTVCTWTPKFQCLYLKLSLMHSLTS